jgi:hypothetical protein
MKLPISLFAESIEEKKIYFFKHNLFGVKDHMHICLKKPNGNILYFVCCTTKHKTIEKYINLRGFSYSTIVSIPKDDKNCFKEDSTYINCNTVHEGDLRKFLKSYNNEEVKLIGEISDNHFYQILNGINDSRTVPNEIKKAISEFLK